MSDPKLSNLQFLVLGVLRAGPRTGRAVRTELERFDVRKSGPAFYQMMSRLEAAGFVKGWYTQQVVAGQIIRERHYELEAAGSGAWNLNRDFQLEVIRRFGDLEEPAGA
jgi:DNA-binding PadR family transcriptional regulator